MTRKINRDYLESIRKNSLMVPERRVLTCPVNKDNRFPGPNFIIRNVGTFQQ